MDKEFQPLAFAEDEDEVRSGGGIHMGDKQKDREGEEDAHWLPFGSVDFEQSGALRWRSPCRENNKSVLWRDRSAGNTETCFNSKFPTSRRSWLLANAVVSGDYPGLMTDADSAKTAAPGAFNTTHWTLVIDAADTRGEGASAALAQLCETYWYPLYAYVRRFGNGPDEARDLTQAFFEQLLEKKTYKVADRERGKFRTFLLTALKNFLAKEHQKATRQKRGGSATHFSLDFQDAEGRFIAEPSHEVTPEKLFEREWAKALLGRALAHVRTEYAASGRVERFDVLSTHLVQPEGDESYADLAEKLGLSLAVIKTSMHRLRARFRSVYREEIAAMVGGQEEVDDEIRHLFQTLGGS